MNNPAAQQPATSATGRSLIGNLLLRGWIGALAGLLIWAIVALAANRGDGEGQPGAHAADSHAGGQDSGPAQRPAVGARAQPGGQKHSKRRWRRRRGWSRVHVTRAPGHDESWTRVQEARTKASVKKARTEASLQKTRAWAAALVVFLGAAAITVVTLWGLTNANSINITLLIAFLSSAFTAIATMITAYFGIRAVTNAAQSAVANQPAGNQPADDHRPVW